MLGGISNLLQAVPHPLAVLNVCSRNGGHANNGIHGRAYFVGHTRKEVGFGPVSLFRHGQCILQGLGLGGQFPLHLP